VDFALKRLALANRSVGRILACKNSAPTRFPSMAGHSPTTPTEGN
jgi:hypothetical protein